MRYWKNKQTDKKYLMTIWNSEIFFGFISNSKKKSDAGGKREI